MKKFGEFVIISQRLRKSNTLIYKGLLSIFLVFIERVLTLQYYQSCVDSLYILALLNPNLYSGICLKLNNRVSNTKRCISIYFLFILSSPDSKSHVKYCYHMTYVVVVRKHLHLNPLWNHWTNRNQNCYECSLDNPLQIRKRHKTPKYVVRDVFVCGAREFYNSLVERIFFNQSWLSLFLYVPNKILLEYANKLFMALVIRRY